MGSLCLLMIIMMMSSMISLFQIRIYMFFNNTGKCYLEDKQQQYDQDFQRIQNNLRYTLFYRHFSFLLIIIIKFPAKLNPNIPYLIISSSEKSNPTRSNPSFKMQPQWHSLINPISNPNPINPHSDSNFNPNQQHTFPLNNIIGLKFKDIKDLRTHINTQARQRNLPQMTTWFQLSSQDQNYTILKCHITTNCKAYIKLLYVQGYGFTVDSVTSKHQHGRNLEIEEIKQHHIIKPYLEKYRSTKIMKQVSQDNKQNGDNTVINNGKYRVRTNCCCKNNPGQAAIAYSISSPKGQLLIETGQKFQNFTNNKAQFTAVMFSLLNCFEHGITRIQINNRSKLLVDYMNGLTKITAPNLREIAEAAKLLATRLGGQITYVFMSKYQSSVKLQNVCRKLLELQEVQDKDK